LSYKIFFYFLKVLFKTVAEAEVVQAPELHQQGSQAMRHEEKYLGYVLIAQEWQGNYQGRAWASGEKISATGESLAEVIQKLKRLIPQGGAKKSMESMESALVVGTLNSKTRVFHRPQCGWMRHVSAENEIRFASRQAALDHGFYSCNSCRA
jgi:hypothetical protein